MLRGVIISNDVKVPPNSIIVYYLGKNSKIPVGKDISYVGKNGLGMHYSLNSDRFL